MAQIKWCDACGANIPEGEERECAWCAVTICAKCAQEHGEASKDYCSKAHYEAATDSPRLF